MILLGILFSFNLKSSHHNHYSSLWLASQPTRGKCVYTACWAAGWHTTNPGNLCEKRRFRCDGYFPPSAPVCEHVVRSVKELAKDEVEHLVNLINWQINNSTIPLSNFVRYWCYATMTTTRRKRVEGKFSVCTFPDRPQQNRAPLHRTTNQQRS